MTGKALLVVFAGATAALHVAKLAPAIPTLRDALQISLVQAGFLISLVQLAGMAAGVVVGLVADRLGLRRCMMAGLLLLSLASLAGGFAADATTLLMTRALEGAGFLLACMPAPALIRRLVPASRVNAMLGIWGAYMPLATASALLIGPWVLTFAGWQVWWWLLAALTCVTAVFLYVFIPADPAVSAQQNRDSPDDNWRARLQRTLGARGPWLVAVCFGLYSGQWLAVVGFLPSIYAQASIAAGHAGALTALVALVNMAGNIASGRLLQRGAKANVLLLTGYVAMGLGAVVAFAGDAAAIPAAARYFAVLVFSGVGGLIPGTLFSLAVRVAPDDRTTSTTIGWMHQVSAAGQLLVPPLVGALAGSVGGWQWTWVITASCSMAGMVLATQLARRS